MSAHEQDRLEINWFNSAGAALGAVSAAVVLSSLGAAGTLVGAALGSLCISIGGAVYAHSMRVTKGRVAAAKALASRRKARAQDSVLVGAAASQPPAELGLVDPADAGDPTTTVDSADTSEPGESWAVLLRGLPWKRIGAVSAALFGITMAIILAFELTTGRAVSTYTGGTSDTEVGTTFSSFGARDGDSGSGSGDSDLPEQEQDQPQQEDSGEVPAEEAPAEEDSQELAPAEDDPAPAEPESEETPAPVEQPEPEPAPAPAEQVPGE